MLILSKQILLASFALVGAMQIFCVPIVQAKAAAPLKGSKLKVWRFEQTNQIGKATVLVAESGIKITNSNQNVVWICTAPDWNVTIVNYKLNIGKQVPLAEYAAARKTRFEFSRVTGAEKRETIVFLGKPCNKVTYRILSSDPVKERIEMIYQTGSQRASSFNAAELIYSNWFKIKPQICSFMSGLYGAPNVSGVVLNQTYLYPGKRDHVVLSTSTITQAEVDKSEFKVPTGYKFAHMHEIMQEEKKAVQMSGVIEDLFLDAPSKKPTATENPAASRTSVRSGKSDSALKNNAKN